MDLRAAARRRSACTLIAEAQARGGICAFMDMEHALDPVYAERIGVDVSNLYIAQPDTAEQALEITEALVRSGALDVVVLDSVAALVPKS
jgi:recombination protein RecA